MLMLVQFQIILMGQRSPVISVYLLEYADKLYFSVMCRRQKAAQSPEQTAAATTRRLERCAWSQSLNLIIITGTYVALTATSI